VFRGGFWDYYANGCRTAFRNGSNPGGAYIFVGFRVVRP
jgi:formylglycine-generating enzyme required for sulfatase activity